MTINAKDENGREETITTDDKNPIAVILRATAIVRELQKEGYQPEGINYIGDALKLIAEGLNQCAEPYSWIMKL